MNKQFLKHLLTLVTLCAVLLAPFAVAQGQLPAPPQENVINIDVTSADFHTVVNLLQRESGINMVVRDGEKPYRLVTVRLIDAPLSKALLAVARSAGATVTQDNSGNYTFAPEDGSVPVPASTGPSALSLPHALINPADLRWHEIMLQHAVAVDVLTLMHWDKAKSKVVPAEPDLSKLPMINGFFRTRPFQNDPALPVGVAAVIAWTGPNALLIQATPEGFEQIRQIVKILDVAAREQEPPITLSAISVPEKEAGGLRFDTSSASALKIASGAEVTLLYDRLIKSGHLPIPASPVEDPGVFQPRTWIIPGLLISRTEFHADLSVPMTFELVNGSVKVTFLVHQGEVVALRSSDPSAKGQITLIEAEY